MKLLVISVGRLKHPELKSLIKEYAKRIGRYASYHEKEIKDGPADSVHALIQRSIPKRSRTVALEVTGKSYSSPQFALLIEEAQRDAIDYLVFMIGGAYGLPKELSAQADLRLSLSSLTLPHRLARLFLLEQIYRGFSILANEPYAHEDH